MKRLGIIGLVLAALAVSVAQAQIPPPGPTRPTHDTVYNAINSILAVPTSGPVMQMPASVTTCAVVLNSPSTNTTITPQGSDDGYVWHALSTIGKGSITFPGLYVGQNPYVYFRPYFGYYASPGITGYEACGDNATSVIAPMVNGEDGVLNTYQELIAIGHPGCAVFDANGFLIPNNVNPCGGGGGATCANPPTPPPSPSPLGCVVLQDLASPQPQEYNDGVGSAAVHGILQGGSVYATTGDFETATVMTDVLNLCPGEDCSDWTATYTGSEIDTIMRGYLEQYLGGTYFGTFATTPTPGIFDVEETLDPNSFAILDAAPPSGSGFSSIIVAGSSSDDSGNHVKINSEGLTGSGSKAYVLVEPSSSPGAGPGAIGVPHLVEAGPTLAVGFGGIIQDVPAAHNPLFAGTCTMSSSDSCTQVIATLYTSPACVTSVMAVTPSPQPSPMYGSCLVDNGSQVTIKANASNSYQWAFWVFGANQ